MKNIIYILIFAAALSSCNGNKKIKKELKTLHSAPIILPKNAITTINGQDSIVTDYFDAEMKMVIFIDTAACSSCILSKMNVWKSYFNYSDSLNGRLKYYFILSPSKGEEKKLRIAMRTYPLDYPMMIDKEREFAKLNPHIPDNSALHSFLLDKNNKIVFIGNPTEHEYLKEVFYSKTKALLTDQK